LILSKEYQKSGIGLIDKEKSSIAEVASTDRPKNPPDLETQVGENIGPHFLLNYEIL